MQRFCPNCGAELPFQEAEICPKCGVRIKEPPKPKQEKSPGIAAIGSFFFPGTGQVYNGEFGKGLAIFFGTMIGMFIFFIPGIAIWIYGMYDAYTTAKRMNLNEIPYVETNIALIILMIIFEIVVGIIMVVVFAAIIAAFVFGMSGGPYGA
jgi:TM2 domain-containing membrane protein YozV